MASFVTRPLAYAASFFSESPQEKFEKDLKEANEKFDIIKIKETLDKINLELVFDELSFVLSKSLMIFCLSTIQEEDLAYIDLLLGKEIKKDFKSQDDQNYIMALLSSSKLRSREINLNVLEKLLKSEIDPNIPDKYGVLPLEIVPNHLYAQMLLKNGANPNQLGSSDHSPLYHVIKDTKILSDESIKIIRLLIDAGAYDMECIISTYGKVRLSDLLGDLNEFEGKKDLLEILKKNEKRSEDLSLSNLIHMDPVEVQQLIELSKKECTLFIRQRDSDEKERVEFVLAPKEEMPESEDLKKFKDICDFEKFNSFKDDLEGIKENFQKIKESYPCLFNQVLYDICKNLKNEKQLDIARELIENGANTNFRMDNGYTPLIAICKKIEAGNNCVDELKLLQMLLENKADVNIFYMKPQKIQWPSEKANLEKNNILLEKDIIFWLEKYDIDPKKSIKLICYDEKLAKSVLDFTFHPKAVEILTQKGARLYGEKKPPSWVASTKFEKAKCEKYRNEKLISHLKITKELYEVIRLELKPISKKS